MTDQPLPTPRSLRGAVQAAAARGEPLVVLASLTGCVYCAFVRRSHLAPLMREGQLVAVQIDVQDRTTPIQGFDGATTTPAALAQAWQALFTPTVMFFGPDGRERAERLVGVSSTDFYGVYLEQRLSAARQTLR